jgi:hypothetical protein
MADPWLAAGLVASAVACLSGAGRGRRTGAAILVACAAFLAWKVVGAVRAIEAYENAWDGGGAAQQRIVEAQWASLSQWHVFDRTSTHVRAWRTDGVTRQVQLLLAWPIERETPLVEASRSLSTVRNFLRSHGLGFAVTVPRSNAENWVLWSDVRYCSPSARTPAEPELTITRAGTSLGCALWFGGAFDRERNPLLEIVKIGRFTQTRELSP